MVRVKLVPRLVEDQSEQTLLVAQRLKGVVGEAETDRSPVDFGPAERPRHDCMDAGGRAAPGAAAST